jgi:hypothetical protein
MGVIMDKKEGGICMIVFGLSLLSLSVLFAIFALFNVYAIRNMEHSSIGVAASLITWVMSTVLLEKGLKRVFVEEEDV